jgi:hypothetical protein
MIGGHSQNDGGFKMLPLTEQRAERLAATIRVNVGVIGEWMRAAEGLSAAASAIAAYGGNLMLARELREAEATYDAAKAAAKEIMSAYLPPERS